MRRRTVVILAAITILVAHGSTANASSDERLVTVSGQAELRVVPNEALVSVGVETFDPDLAKAKSANDSRVTAILAAAEALDVPREHIKTEYVRIEPEYRFTDGARHFLHYSVRKSVVITLRDIDKFETLLANVLEAGANYVHGVDFRTTELRQHRDRARALAIVAAKEKAQALAQELGESVGRVHTIQEGYNRWWSWYGSWWGGPTRGGMAQNVIQNVGAAPEGLEGPTAPGQITIDASVTVAFELVD